MPHNKKFLQLASQGKARSALLSLLGLSLLLLVQACAPPPPPADRLPAPPDTAQRLLTEWVGKSARFETLRGLAQVKIKAPDHSFSATQAVLAERPAKLRAEALGTFGTPLLLLTTDGDDLGVLVPSRNTYYFGRADAGNIGLFTQIPVDAVSLVQILLYSPPLPAYDEINAWLLGNGGWLLELSSWTKRQELVFDTERRLVESRYFDGNQLNLKLAYSDFTGNDSGFPRRIRIDLLQYDAQANIVFSELETNQELSPELFRPEPPRGIKMYDLDQVYDSSLPGEQR